MIFPDKPRPPWQQTIPRVQFNKFQSVTEKTKPSKNVKPKEYYRERIEFVVIVVGMYFWIQYWIQFV